MTVINDDPLVIVFVLVVLKGFIVVNNLATVKVVVSKIFSHQKD